jgi:hypothetical protein
MSRPEITPPSAGLQPDLIAYNLRRLVRCLETPGQGTGLDEPVEVQAPFPHGRILEATSSEHAFGAPLQDPSFRHERAYDPVAGSGAGFSESIWLPTKVKPGQHRVVTVGGPGEAAPVDAGPIEAIESLAAAGMRPIFAEYEILSSTRLEDTVARGRPVHIKTAALSFPSAEQIEAHTAVVAMTDQSVERFKVRFVDPRKMLSVDRSKAISEGEVLIALEKDADRLSEPAQYLHGSRLRFPAWLCLPEDITTGIRRQADEFMKVYNVAGEVGSATLAAPLLERMRTMNTLLDTVITTDTLGKVARGEPNNFGESIARLLGWGTPEFFETITREHIANPTADKVLIARRPIV